MSTVILSLAAAGFKPFFSISQQDKPEPSVLGMMALGGLSLVMASRRRRFRGIWPRRASRTQRPVILELGTPPSAGQLDGPKTRALPQSNIFPKTNIIFTESSGDSVLGRREAGQRPPPPRGGRLLPNWLFSERNKGVYTRIRVFTIAAAILAAILVHNMPARARPDSRETAPATVVAAKTIVRQIRALDSARVLSMAKRFISVPPVTITDFHYIQGPKDRHEYYSQSDYAWPNPKNPSGPYIIRDGYSNPANWTADREALIHFSICTAALTSAYIITHEPRYARAAVANISAWFVDKRTRMNPNLRYAQAVHGVAKGTNWGIIDTVHLVEVARSAQILERYRLLAGHEKIAVNKWFPRYLHWLTTSRLGKLEMRARNNHGTCWLVQVAAFASLTGNEKLLHFCRARFKLILSRQAAANGSLPLELARTKPYCYSLFDLDALATACWILSTPNDNLWQYRTTNGRNLRMALRFAFPYIKDKLKWPYRYDVEYFQYWPVRSPSLLFGGLAYRTAKYIRVWKTLNPEPQNPEVLRNLPIREPVLWITDSAIGRNVWR